MNKLNIVSQKPQGRGGASFLALGQSKYLIVGGANRIQELNDVWVLDITVNGGIWTEIKYQNQDLYTPRSGQSAFIDRVGKIYIFGGQIFSTGQQTDEFYEIDHIKQSFMYVKSSNKPKGRNSHSITYDSITNQAYMLGGANENGPLDDFYVFDVQSGKWKEEQLSGYNMKPREMHSANIIQTKQNIQVQQCTIQPLLKQEIKVIPQNNQSQVIELNFNFPNDTINDNIVKVNLIDQSDFNMIDNEESKQNHIEDVVEQINQSTLNNRYLVVMGGRCFLEILNEIILIDLSTFSCTALQTLTTPLCAHSSFTQNSNSIVILGGFSEEGFSSKVYTLFPEENEIKLLDAPQYSHVIARIAISVVEEDQQIILFGGSSIEEESNDIHIIKQLL